MLMLLMLMLMLMFGVDVWLAFAAVWLLSCTMLLLLLLFTGVVFDGLLVIKLAHWLVVV